MRPHLLQLNAIDVIHDDIFSANGGGGIVRPIEDLRDKDVGVLLN
jgi:hypothetical protein